MSERTDNDLTNTANTPDEWPALTYTVFRWWPSDRLNRTVTFTYRAGDEQRAQERRRIRELLR